MFATKYLVLLLCLLSASLHAAEVRFVPGQLDVTPGSVFTLELRGVGFPETEGGGAEFTYDPDILAVTQVILDDSVWEMYTDAETIDNVNGVVEGITVATFRNPGADFSIAIIEFEAVGVGQAALTLSENPSNLWASGGSLINPTLVDGTVTVTSPVNRDGDLAPRGNPDGIINAGDYLVALRIVLELIEPTAEEALRGDVFPSGQGDGVINVSDLLVILGNALN